jgi:hypothetical protein
MSYFEGSKCNPGLDKNFIKVVVENREYVGDDISLNLFRKWIEGWQTHVRNRKTT